MPRFGPKPMPVEPRLITRCDGYGIEESCWSWTAGRFSDGYGQLRVKGKPTKAHRAAYECWIGPIPDGKMVCHRCDNKGCINPNHLFVGTAQDNMDDMEIKGRSRRTGPKYKIGSKHKDAKLTERDVVLLRKLKKSGVSTRLLSVRFGVCTVHINAIARGRYWKHIKGD